MTSAAPQGESSKLLNIPNLLSLARIPLAVALFICITYRFWFAGLIIFVVACMTDWLDGWWARRYGPLTLIGRNLDPLADKVLVCGAFIYLMAVPGAGLLPWMVTVVIVRELLVTGIRGMVEAAGKTFGADWFGKLKMGLQCAWIIAILTVLALHANGIAGLVTDWLLVVQLILLWSMLVATVGSGAQYVLKAMRLLGPERPQSPARNPARLRLWAPILLIAATAGAIALLRGPREPEVYPAVTDSPYRLPWPGGVSHLCVQGNHGLISHFGTQEFAYDFAMPVGSPVCAARAGVVIFVEHEHEGYGLRAPGNEVIVSHGDGTAAVYAHIRRGGSRVREGDGVTQGQIIAESGNVGTSLIQHLHFHVYNSERNQVRVTFPEAAADGGIPRMLKSYTSANLRPE